jgi:hypothetical protein
LVPDFDPPLPEDAIQRARTQAHAKGVKKKKDEEKVKKASRVQRKEEREKRQKMQRQAGEEESSSIDEDDEDDNDEGDHLYDWLDSMAEEGNSLEGRPSRLRGGRHRLNCCAANRTTLTLGELRRWVEERSPRGHRGRPVLRGWRIPDPRRRQGHRHHPLSPARPRLWRPGRGLVP